MKVWILLLACGLVVASAARYEDDISDLDDIDPDDSSAGKTLLDRLRDGLQRGLERIKARVEKNKEIAGEFREKIKELAEKIKSLGKELNRKTIDKIKEINGKLRQLARDVLKRLGNGKVAKRGVADELKSTFLEIKKIIMNDDGLNEVRQHIRRMKTSNPVLKMVQSYIETADNEHLKELLTELFSGLKEYVKRDLRRSTRLETLFQRVAELLYEKEGFDALYNYILHLQSDHPLIQRLHTIFLLQDKEDVRDILYELIEAFEH